MFSDSGATADTDRPSNSGEEDTPPPTASDPRQHKRILVVVNPVAGPRGSHGGTLKDLRERASKAGIHLDFVETRLDLNGTQAVASAPGDYDCYLAMGGDGTVMEVAEAAMTNHVPMAVLPRGTANAVAWHFGLPFDVARAFLVAVQGKPVQIDVARAPQRKFLIVAGLGYDAHVIKDATRVLKRRLGFLAYLYASLKNLGRRPYSFRVALDDQEPFRVRGAAALITNTGTLAGNIRVVRDINPHDGLLDLVVIAPATFTNFFRMFFLGVLGRLHEDPRVRYFQASRIVVDCRPSAPLEIDGDEIEGGNLRKMEVDILPGALTIMVPPEGMWKVPWMPDVPWSPSLPKIRPKTGGYPEKST